MTSPKKAPSAARGLTAAALTLLAAPAVSDTITGDLSVRSHLCVGESCLDGGVQTFVDESFLIDANNPWIKFEDSSGINNFPTNDWQLKVNDTFDNGENYIAIEDLDGGTVPFRVDAGARDNALRVAGNGRVGIGTGLPVEELHVVVEDSPTLRLEQTAGSFPAQTWDILGNETNFSIRDVTNTSTNEVLPFRIFPGAANNNGLVIQDDGDIGLGTQSPQAKLHVAGTSMLIKNAGRVNFTLSDTSDPGPDFRTQLTAGTARFSFVGTGAPEMELFQTGDLSIRGRYISAGTTLTVPDYVFDEDYALRPLAEVQSFIDTHSHLPDVPSAADIAADGLDITEMQMTLLKKIEELTLYTLEQEAKNQAQEATIQAQEATIQALQAKNAAQETRLAEVEALNGALASLTARLDALEAD